MPSLGIPFRIDRIERQLFEEQGLAKTTTEQNALTFVSCGHPLEGHAIRIVNDEGKVLPERIQGNLQFQGPSSMQGYFNNRAATEAIYHQGWWDTGDLAYQADGELFLTGRRKDLIVKAGRNLYPAEIEELVATLPEIRKGCVAAFGIADNQRGTEQLVVVAETHNINKEERAQLTAQLNQLISSTLDILPDHIVLVAPHKVPKTSSGKLQRLACKALYLEGKLTKTQLPAWLQMIRMSLASFLHKAKEGAITLGKLIYTIYFAFIYLLVTLPAYLLVKVGSPQFARQICKWRAKILLLLGGCPVKVIGKENLIQPKPVIFASNHASYIDAIVMASLLPLKTRFVAKKELFSLPLLGGVLEKIGFIALSRDDLPRGLEDTRQILTALKEGHSVLIFPEGTFGYSFGLRPFRMGAFKIATEASLPICPVAMQGTRVILRDVELLMRPGFIKVTICPPIQPLGKEWREVTQLRSAVRAEIIKYCGEPSLDFIAAQTVAPSRKIA